MPTPITGGPRERARETPINDGNYRFRYTIPHTWPDGHRPSGGLISWESWVQIELAKWEGPAHVRAWFPGQGEERFTVDWDAGKPHKVAGGWGDQRKVVIDSDLELDVLYERTPVVPA